jgi:dTDP-4-amino-4,6-dideoxygalactose transaminase
MHTAYKNLGFAIKNYPNAYQQYQNEITLPLHTLLSDEDVVYVCDSLKSSIAELRRAGEKNSNVG